MPYELHIEGIAGNLNEDAWLRLVHEDPSLAPAPEFFEATNSQTGDLIRMRSRPGQAVRNDGPLCSFHDGSITFAVRGTNEDLVAKAVEIAQTLGGGVIGDGGESYPR